MENSSSTFRNYGIGLGALMMGGSAAVFTSRWLSLNRSARRPVQVSLTHCPCSTSPKAHPVADQEAQTVHSSLKPLEEDTTSSSSDSSDQDPFETAEVQTIPNNGLERTQPRIIKGD